MPPVINRLALWVFAIALVGLVLGAGGGPGWTAASDHAVLAAYLERSAGSPLYDLVAGAAAHLPAGEIGFRLALFAAVLGALLLAGVVRATRALLPADPLAGATGALLLALAPPFRDAAAFGGPGALAACGSVWAIAFALEHARGRSARAAAAALAALAVVAGAAPWLGVGLAGLAIGWLARSGAPATLLAAGTGGLGAVAVVLWIGATGAFPGPAPAAAVALAGSGRGAAAIVVGAGLLGAGFGAVTGLAHARWLAAAIAVAGAHAALVEPDPMPVLGLLAIACAIVPAAVARALPGPRRALLVPAAGLPLVAAALLVGPALRVDDPGAAPARLASELINWAPPGPGAIVATRAPTWSAIHYAQAVAGARPDLALAPRLAADDIVVNTLRGGGVAVADEPAFGRLDARLARPRGRGFELLLAPPSVAGPPPSPARYASAIGGHQAILLALARARYEAGAGRLDDAARAVGLTARFGAGDLAILATTRPSAERPSLFSFVPALSARAPGPWLFDLFGDDLAWLGGLDLPPPPAGAPSERLLHAAWRALWLGQIRRDDPTIAALGPAALRATDEMLAALQPAPPAPPRK